MHGILQESAKACAMKTQAGQLNNKPQDEDDRKIISLLNSSWRDCQKIIQDGGDMCFVVEGIWFTYEKKYTCIKTPGVFDVNLYKRLFDYPIQQWLFKIKIPSYNM